MSSPEHAGRTSTIASVDKAIKAIERLASPGAMGMTLADLALDLGLNKSSLHHTLATLRARGWVEQDDEGRYRLGPASVRIAAWWGDEAQVVRLLRPALERVCAASHETVHLGRLSGRSIIYLDKIEPDRAVRVVSSVGRRVPAATTSLGRAVLGALPADELAATDWVAAADSPRDDLAKRLAQEVERVHLSGYAVEIEENEPGIACVGVPLLVAGRPTTAISVTMPVERCSAERLRELAAMIRAAAADLTDDHITLVETTV